jgi:hypothetical protein
LFKINRRGAGDRRIGGRRLQMKRLGVMCLLVLSVAVSVAAPADADLHAYWDQRCSDCHGHAGDFARRFLRVEAGRLVGAHHRDDLAGFLRNHYLTDSLVSPVSAMLAAQVATTPVFRDKCGGCHGSAAEFARKSLAVREGVLVGAKSGRKVADYLASHGGLAPADIPGVVDSLARVRSELAGPGQ